MLSDLNKLEGMKFYLNESIKQLLNLQLSATESFLDSKSNEFYNKSFIKSLFFYKVSFLS